MKAVGRTILTIMMAMAMAGGSAAQARTVDAGTQPYCAELRRIVAATGEWPPFQPVSAWERIVVSGFEQPCGLRSHGSGWRFLCSRSDSQSPDDMARLVAQTAACWMRPSVFPTRPRAAAPDSGQRPRRFTSSGRESRAAPARR
jgi:hypothetical protein